MENKYISTNMGDIPVWDYLDIVAIQNGFYDYEDVVKQGYHIEGSTKEEEKWFGEVTNLIRESITIKENALTILKSMSKSKYFDFAILDTVLALNDNKKISDRIIRAWSEYRYEGLRTLDEFGEYLIDFCTRINCPLVIQGINILDINGQKDYLSEEKISLEKNNYFTGLSAKDVAKKAAEQQHTVQSGTPGLSR